jgi:hypothetical protein
MDISGMLLRRRVCVSKLKCNNVHDLSQLASINGKSEPRIGKSGRQKEKIMKKVGKSKYKLTNKTAAVRSPTEGAFASHSC